MLCCKSIPHRWKREFRQRERERKRWCALGRRPPPAQRAPAALSLSLLFCAPSLPSFTRAYIAQASRFFDHRQQTQTQAHTCTRARTRLTNSQSRCFLSSPPLARKQQTRGPYLNSAARAPRTSAPPIARGAHGGQPAPGHGQLVPRIGTETRTQERSTAHSLSGADSLSTLRRGSSSAIILSSRARRQPNQTAQP